MGQEQPGLHQLEHWKSKLSRLQDEMEKAYGEPSSGMYDDKLPTLVRYAWEEALAECERLKCQAA
jgi:hypothetical protein